jgi:hypothetical protein
MIRIQTEAFTKLLTTDLDSDLAQEREAGNLRRLTLYNGHSLPSIDRQKMRDDNHMVGPEFHFELWQVTETDPPHKHKTAEM